jgi:hypothetical protein
VLEEGVAEDLFNRSFSGIRNEPRKPRSRWRISSAADLHPHGPAGQKWSAIAKHSFVNSLEGAHLGSRETACAAGFSGALGQVCRRLERAATRIVNDAVLCAVDEVAFRVDGIRDDLQLLHSNRRRSQRTLIVHVADHRPGKTQHWRPDGDAIEIVRKALSGDQTLAPARRATVEIGSARCGRVVRLRYSLRRERRDVNGAIRVVEKLLRRRGKGGEWLHCRVMPRIRLRGGEASCERTLRRCDTDRCVKRLAGESAVTEHIQPAVPRRGQVYFESYFRLNQADNPAVFREIPGCRNRGCCRDRKVVPRQRDQRGATR